MAEKRERSGIVSAGSWCIDHNMVIDRWPAEETLSIVQADSRQGGCPGHNMSSALKRLGATFPVEGIGLIGDDDNGRLLFELCDSLGIDRTQIGIRPATPTAVALVMIDQTSAKRTFFYLAGAHNHLSPDHFDFARTKSKIAHVGLPGTCGVLDNAWKGDASGWVTVLKAARTAGLKTNIELVSAAPDVIRRLTEPMLPHLDMMVINDLEAGAVAGVETVRNGVTDVAACREAAAKLIERSVASLVAVHYPMGGVLATRKGEVVQHPSVNVPPELVKSTNGAGDCFAAGILYGVHEGWPLEQTMKLAHATAAVSLRDASTTGSVVLWQECLQLAERWGWRAA